MNLSANTQLCNISHICVFIYNNSEANFSGQNCSQLVIYVFYVSFLCLTISFSLSRLAYNMSIVDKKKADFYYLCLRYGSLSLQDPCNLNRCLC